MQQQMMQQQQMMMQQQMMGQQMMGQQMMGQGGQPGNPQLQQMYSPSNYDPLMLQQIAPVQNAQSFQSMGMPANIKAMPDINRNAAMAPPVQLNNSGALTNPVPAQFSLKGGSYFNNRIPANVFKLANLKLASKFYF